MTGETMIGQRVTCDHCGDRPAHVRVKHRETCRHWRCVTCFRRIVAEGPVIVTGYAIRGKVVSAWDVDRDAEVRALAEVDGDFGGGEVSTAQAKVLTGAFVDGWVEFGNSITYRALERRGLIEGFAWGSSFAAQDIEPFSRWTQLTEAGVRARKRLLGDL